MEISRRQFTRLAVGATALRALSLPSASQAQAAATAEPGTPTAAERDAMANLAHAFMDKYNVPAFSLAIGFGGKILHEAALGWADRESHAAVTPANRFRIASVSKPITSVVIFSLIEQGRIKLTDKVFGPGAIFGIDYGRPPYHPHIDEITVEHLLTHTCGGWSNAHNGPHGDDPMFINIEMNHAQLITWTLRNRPLDNPPGVHFDYSNFGYCVLGRVIEKITRQPYAAYTRDALLKRCGIDDMVIAGNTLAQRQPGEVKYYGQGENPYGINITRMDSHGGWIARPADIVQFFMHVDGFCVAAQCSPAADASDDDDPIGRERRLRERLDGEQGQQLVAQRHLARDINHRGAYAWRILLGSIHQYAQQKRELWRRSGQACLEHGPPGQGLARIIL